MTNGGGDAASGKLGVTGRIGAVRVNVAASATGKRDAFQPTNPRALADTDIKLEGRIEADEPASAAGADRPRPHAGGGAQGRRG